MRRSAYLLTALLLTGIVVSVNILSNRFRIRLDFTQERQFTLSQGSRDLLDSLKEPVTIRAYFSDNLPVNLKKVSDQLEYMLSEYEHAGKGNVVYEFIDPSTPEKEREAVEAGIQPLTITVREKDRAEQQKAFLGLVLVSGEQQEVIPVMDPAAGIEYTLSRSIKKLSAGEKPVVGFLRGHGEAKLSEMAELNALLEVSYESEEIQFADSVGVPDYIEVVCIIGPEDTIPPDHLAKLDAFLARGGRVFAAVNRVQGSFENFMGTGLNIQFEAWLKNKGIRIEENFLVDNSCGAILRQSGGMSVTQSFHFFPVITTFADHPVSGGLEAVMLNLPSEVKPAGGSALRFTPLLFTSEISDVKPAPQQFDLEKKWSKDEFTRSNLVAAAAVEGKLSGDADSRMVVVSDAEFIINGEGRNALRVQPDNLNFALNAIDWLSDDTGLIELRTKLVTHRGLREISDGKRIALKYLNFLLPLAMITAMGLLRARAARRRRRKRKEEDYSA